MSLTPNRRLVVVVLLVPLVVTLALWAFAWPAARTAPRDLPVGIAGTAPAADRLQQRFEERDGAFDVHRYDSEAAARDAIEDRTVYGAVVVTAKGPELLTASAGSTVVAQLLREAVTAGAPAGTAVPVTDVVAAPAADPRGAVLGSSILPLAIAGVAAGAAVTVLRLRGARAAVALLGVAVMVGLLATAVTDSWLGALPGDWWSEAGTIALTVLAIGAPVAGLAALLGTPGIGLGALLMVLLGNPFSGVTSAPELLPRPIAVIGQLLPPGAAGSALRSVAFFDGAAAAVPALTLGVWAVLGLGAVLVGGRRRTAADTTAPASAREPALAG
ncbi:ABC transporter permease [Streptomyces sp. NBC_00523]|uniref:ABC transporter permease n=1 Tax=unclassified Streptomyces TaxID=2593676 RepID=UPI002E80AD53|nr:ABC transporter permease [Streptomyces sp. NBC_00523]WUC98910.1 ABC transporter permease [Streptomyces sp. NBC_00523]